MRRYPAPGAVYRDTDHDYEIASSIGCDCALLIPGTRQKRILEKLDALLIDSLCEIPGLLEE
jgi:phosphoglycolate phosphatase-like HAD superfamily hydrolase